MRFWDRDVATKSSQHQDMNYGHQVPERTELFRAITRHLYAGGKLALKCGIPTEAV